MKLPLIITSVLMILILLGFYFLVQKPRDGETKHVNWNLELTKPLGYEINVGEVAFYKDGIEINRRVSMNSLQGWTGTSGGRVLHNKQKEELPDSLKLTWEEGDTRFKYRGIFKFPKEKILDLWNQNYDLLQQRWGEDYPKGQLSLKLGLAPGGVVVLWFADLDVNTSGFAMEVAIFTASVDGVDSVMITPASIDQKRYGEAHFYPPIHHNVVSIDVTYYNGEKNTINLKKRNESILEQVNAEIGWGLVDVIVVSWFDEANIGYRSRYKVALEDKLIKNEIQCFRSDSQLVYLLDRDEVNTSKLTGNKYLINLKEISREVLK